MDGRRQASYAEEGLTYSKWAPSNTMCESWNMLGEVKELITRINGVYFDPEDDKPGAKVEANETSDETAPIPGEDHHIDGKVQHSASGLHRGENVKSLATGRLRVGHANKAKAGRQRTDGQRGNRASVRKPIKDETNAKWNISIRGGRGVFREERTKGAILRSTELTLSDCQLQRTPRTNAQSLATGRRRTWLKQPSYTKDYRGQQPRSRPAGRDLNICYLELPELLAVPRQQTRFCRPLGYVQSYTKSHSPLLTYRTNMSPVCTARAENPKSGTGLTKESYVGVLRVGKSSVFDRCSEKY